MGIVRENFVDVRYMIHKPNLRSIKILIQTKK